MTSIELIKKLETSIPNELAVEIVDEFMTSRSDVITGTLGKSAPGKFVESTVQILQYISSGYYKKTFKTGEIEDFLKNTESRSVDLSPDLKLVMTRVVRGIYALRSKRGITHKGTINPNVYDLRYLYSAAQWVLSEITRNLLSSDMDSAGKLIEFIQLPARSVKQ